MNKNIKSRCGTHETNIVSIITQFKKIMRSFEQNENTKVPSRLLCKKFMLLMVIKTNLRKNKNI